MTALLLWPGHTENDCLSEVAKKTFLLLRACFNTSGLQFDNVPMLLLFLLGWGGVV